MRTSLFRPLCLLSAALVLREAPAFADGGHGTIPAEAAEPAPGGPPRFAVAPPLSLSVPRLGTRKSSAERPHETRSHERMLAMLASRSQFVWGRGVIQTPRVTDGLPSTAQTRERILIPRTVEPAPTTPSVDTPPSTESPPPAVSYPVPHFIPGPVVVGPVVTGPIVPGPVPAPPPLGSGQVTSRVGQEVTIRWPNGESRTYLDTGRGLVERTPGTAIPGTSLPPSLSASASGGGVGWIDLMSGDRIRYRWPDGSSRVYLRGADGSVREDPNQTI